MPGLRACGRTWEFGSDDLFFPAIISVGIRVFWFLGVLGGVVYFREPVGCEHSHYLAAFASSILFTTLITIVTEVMILFFSARGTIVRTRPRKPIVHLLYFRIILLIFEFIVLIIGTALAFQPREKNTCEDLNVAVLVVQLIVGAGWCVLLIFLIVSAIYMDPCHCYSAKVNYTPVTTRIQEGNLDRTVAETHWRLNHSVWEKRFRVMCCLTGSDDTHQVAYREVAEVFAHLFSDTNVVPSDIAAGMVLLQREHLALERELRSKPQQWTKQTRIKESPSVVGDDIDEPDQSDVLLSFDFNHDEDRELFQDALHYSKYALGMYSWPLYVYMNPFCGLCRLYSRLHCGGCCCCCGRLCCCCCKGGGVVYENVVKDNHCFCYLEGLKQVTGLNDSDIIYISFDNRIYKVPFMVCLDHQMRSVVIAFRGTLSFPDIVTDLTASTRPIELPDFPSFLVHKGMLKTVTEIIKKLEDEGILEKAFNKVNNYNLVVTGHSLGSGCACIFSILLREKYPDLRCFCYSPTGALLNEAAAEHTESFVTSVTLGKDLVARLNVPNTHQLKNDLVRVIEACEKPKCQILFEGCLETLSTCFGGRIEEMYSNRLNIQRGYTFVRNDETSDNERQPTVIQIEPTGDDTETMVHNECNEHDEANLIIPSPTENGNQEGSLEITPLLNPALSSIALPVRSHRQCGNHSPSPIGSLTTEVERRLVPLFLPGRIIHIVDTSQHKPCFFGTRQLEARWASRKDFNKISISPEMIRDHLPDVLTKAMDRIWRKKSADLEDRAVNMLGFPQQV